jgi:hypothetical protein
MNPIEQAFSKVKGLLRRAESRTREALIGAMGRALDAVSARDARGFFGLPLGGPTAMTTALVTRLRHEMAGRPGVRRGSACVRAGGFSFGGVGAPDV